VPEVYRFFVPIIVGIKMMTCFLEESNAGYYA